MQNAYPLPTCLAFGVPRNLTTAKGSLVPSAVSLILGSFEASFTVIFRDILVVSCSKVVWPATTVQPSALGEEKKGRTSFTPEAFRKKDGRSRPD